MPGDNEAPLQGLRVIEFSHMAMGPSAGVILGDLASLAKDGVISLGDDADDVRGMPRTGQAGHVSENSRCRQRIAA